VKIHYRDLEVGKTYYRVDARHIHRFYVYGIEGVGNRDWPSIWVNVNGEDKAFLVGEDLPYKFFDSEDEAIESLKAKIKNAKMRWIEKLQTQIEEGLDFINNIDTMEIEIGDLSERR